MSFVIKHRSGDTIPTNSNQSKTFESKQEAKNYIVDYGLGGQVMEK